MEKKRMTSAVAFYCRASKSDKQGLSPIEMSITINGERLFVQTHRKAKAKDFEKYTSQRQSNELKEFLELYRARVNEAMTELLKADRPITASSIKQVIRDGLGKKVVCVEGLVKEFCNMVGQRQIGLDQLKRYHQVGEFLIEYFSPSKDIQEINIQSIKNLQEKLYNENKTSTAGGKMAKVKAIFKYAFDSGYIPTNVIGQVRIKKGRPKIEFLTREELHKIENRDFTIERLCMVRDLFLLQCYSGLSYVDLQKMEVDKIERIDGAWVYRGMREKTTIPFVSVLSPKFISILKKYYNKIPKLSNQKLNSYLKEVGDLSGVQKNLHTHLARKTYGHMLVDAGVPMEVIAKTLGHSNTRITEAIYAVQSTSKIVQAANIW